MNLIQFVVAKATRAELEQLAIDQNAEIQRLLKEIDHLHEEFEMMANGKEVEQ